jgi:hypothetical protein
MTVVADNFAAANSHSARPAEVARAARGVAAAEDNKSSADFPSECWSAAGSPADCKPEARSELQEEESKFLRQDRVRIQDRDRYSEEAAEEEYKFRGPDQGQNRVGAAEADCYLFPDRVQNPEEAAEEEYKFRGPDLREAGAQREADY